MKNNSNFVPSTGIRRPLSASTLATTLATTLLLAPRFAAAEDQAAVVRDRAALATGVAAPMDHSGWSFNATPVLVLPKDAYRWGGGADPELKYTLDLGLARVSVGGRVGAYYAKNLFGLSAMPTVRVMVPAGAFEPYVAAGIGYGWLPKPGQGDVMTMARAGFVYRFSKKVAIGLEGTLQQQSGSDFRFPSIGSMMAFDL